MTDSLKNKQFEEELKRYKDISSCMADWIWEVNDLGQYTFVEGKVEDILGYKPDELIGTTPFDFMTEEEGARVGSLFGDIVSNNAPIVDLENWNIAKDGSLVCLLTNGTPIFDADGVVLGYRGVDTDITKRKQNELLLIEEIKQRKIAEITLKEHEKKLEEEIELRTSELKEKIRELGFQKLSMDEHSIVSITDVNGTITYVNQKFCDISGFSEQELLGQNHRITKSGEHSKEFYTELWETITNGKVWQGVLKSNKKISGYYWAEVTITPFLNNINEPFQYVSIRTDITKRIDSENRYRELFENMSDGVAVYKANNDGEEFKFVGYNRAAEILTNVSRSDILGKSVTDVFPAVESLGLFDVFKRVWRTGQPEKYPSKKYQDGRISFWVENYVFKLQSDEMVSIFHNLSELKINEQALVDSRNEAEKANKSKSEFLSQMSHELRTPLNAILGFGQLLELDKEMSSKNQQQNVKEILDAGYHLLNLINEVLDLSRIEAGKVDINLENISVASIIEQCLTLIAPQAKERDVTLIDNLSSEDNTVRADVTRLKQVLLNFLSNAVKYNREHGNVFISSEIVNKHRIRISVADTGKGLSDADIKKLYTPFDRLNAESNIEGTGIGLVISKHLIELMNGAMGVDSVPGEGSTFWVELELPQCT